MSFMSIKLERQEPKTLEYKNEISIRNVTCPKLPSLATILLPVKLDLWVDKTHNYMHFPTTGVRYIDSQSDKEDGDEGTPEKNMDPGMDVDTLGVQKVSSQSAYTWF